MWIWLSDIIKHCGTYFPSWSITGHPVLTAQYRVFRAENNDTLIIKICSEIRKLYQFLVISTWTTWSAPISPLLGKPPLPLPLPYFHLIENVCHCFFPSGDGIAVPFQLLVTTRFLPVFSVFSTGKKKIGFFQEKPNPACGNWKTIWPSPFKFSMWVIWKILKSSSNLGLRLQIIGQWRPLRGQILGFYALFGPVLEKGMVYDLKDHKYKAYICLL